MSWGRDTGLRSEGEKDDPGRATVCSGSEDNPSTQEAERNAQQGWSARSKGMPMVRGDGSKARGRIMGGCVRDGISPDTVGSYYGLPGRGWE